VSVARPRGRTTDQGEARPLGSQACAPPEYATRGRPRAVRAPPERAHWPSRSSHAGQERTPNSGTSTSPSFLEHCRWGCHARANQLTDRKFNGPNEVRSERGQREAWDAEHGAAGLSQARSTQRTSNPSSCRPSSTRVSGSVSS